MRKPALFLTSIISIIVILSVIQVIISNSLSTTGIALSKIENEINAYDKENTLLMEEVLQESSLNNLSLKIDKYGFIDDKSRVFLSVPLPLAIKQ